MEASPSPRSDQALSNLFRKFSSYKLAIKEHEAKLKGKRKTEKVGIRLMELEKDAREIQKIKNRYTFGDSDEAKVLAKELEENIENLEMKFHNFKRLVEDSRSDKGGDFISHESH